MRCIFVWSILLGVAMSCMVGCGEDDNAVLDETQKIGEESVDQISHPIVDQWLVVAMVYVEDGVEKRQEFESDMGSVVFAFHSDASFIGILESVTGTIQGWEDIPVVKINYIGMYTMDDSSVTVNITSAQVSPPEAKERDDELQNPVFVWAGKTGEMKYSLKDENSIMELVNDQNITLILERHNP